MKSSWVRHLAGSLDKLFSHVPLSPNSITICCYFIYKMVNCFCKSTWLSGLPLSIRSQHMHLARGGTTENNLLGKTVSWVILLRSYWYTSLCVCILTMLFLVTANCSAKYAIVGSRGGVWNIIRTGAPWPFFSSKNLSA